MPKCSLTELLAWLQTLLFTLWSCCLFAFAYCLYICWQGNICVWSRCQAWVSLWQPWTRGSCRLSSRARRPSPCSCLLLMVTLWRAPGSSSRTPAPVRLFKDSSGQLCQAIKKNTCFFWFVPVFCDKWETRKLQLLFLKTIPAKG